MQISSLTKRVPSFSVITEPFLLHHDQELGPGRYGIDAVRFFFLFVFFCFPFFFVCFFLFFSSISIRIKLQHVNDGPGRPKMPVPLKFYHRNRLTIEGKIGLGLASS